MAYRDAASFGKRQEYVAIAELLRRGFDVYMTLVDDQQIDCVVRMERDERPVYVDVQIKARSNDAKPKNAGTFASLEIRNPRPNFFFIFYSEQASAYWILPSLDVVRLANKLKSGKTKGRYRIVFTNALSTGAVRPRPKFESYLNNFDLLRQYQG